MATAPAPKIRRRTLDRFRQKLWAVPARLRLRLSQRAAVKPRVSRSVTYR